MAQNEDVVRSLADVAESLHNDLARYIGMFPPGSWGSPPWLCNEPLAYHWMQGGARGECPTHGAVVAYADHPEGLHVERQDRCAMVTPPD